MSQGEPRDPRVEEWLDEGMRYYSAGDAARALDAWYRVLDVEPKNGRALQYVAYVRQLLAIDGPPSSMGAVSGRAAAAPNPAEAALEEAQIVVDEAPVRAVAPPLVTAAPVVEPPPAPAADGPSWGDLITAPEDVEPERWDTIRKEAQQKFVEQQQQEERSQREEAARREQQQRVDDERRRDEQRLREEERIAAEARRAEEQMLKDELARDDGAPQWGDIAGDATGSARAPVEALRAPAATPSLPPVEVAPVVADAEAIGVVELEAALVETGAAGDPWDDALAEPVRRARSPWDEGVSATAAVDLDAQPTGPSLFDDLLASATPRERQSSSRSLTPASGFSMAMTPLIAATRAEVQAALAAAGVLTSHHDGATPPPLDELGALMQGAQELFALGDFSGSLELVEKVLHKNPMHEGARAYLARNEETLMKMYESKIGSLAQVPRPLVRPDEVIWINLHHRAGFILSQIDGQLAYEDILSVSGMPRFETIRILAELVQNGIIG